jgi:hypothetical protein
MRVLVESGSRKTKQFFSGREKKKKKLGSDICFLGPFSLLP